MRGTNAFIRSVTIRVAVPRWLGEKGVGVGDSLREGWKGEDTESIDHWGTVSSRKMLLGSR